jgi:hypothetical protein
VKKFLDRRDDSQIGKFSGGGYFVLVFLEVVQHVAI